MERSLLISLALHGAMLLLLWLGLPMFLPPPAPPTQLVPVEIADVSAITNTRVKPQPAQPKPQQSAKVEEPPKPPTPKPPEQPPVPEQKVTVVEKQEEALPEKPPEKPPEPKKIEPPKKAEEKEKPKPDLLASVLKNVAKIQPKAAPKKTEEPSEEEDSEPESEAPSLSEKLSISEEDALKRQIYGCWNPPIGARNAEQLVVEVLVTVNPDRTVQTAKVTDRSRMAGDSFFRAAAESALRALRHPQCTPLMLPPDKYEQWKIIRFNFDPRQML